MRKIIGYSIFALILFLIVCFIRWIVGSWKETFIGIGIVFLVLLGAFLIALGVIGAIELISNKE